jgi:hypothetical protein
LKGRSDIRTFLNPESIERFCQQPCRDESKPT